MVLTNPIWCEDQWEGRGAGKTAASPAQSKRKTTLGWGGPEGGRLVQNEEFHKGPEQQLGCQKASLPTSFVNTLGAHNVMSSASAAILQISVAFGHNWGHSRESRNSVERPPNLHDEKDTVLVLFCW